MNVARTLQTNREGEEEVRKKEVFEERNKAKGSLDKGKSLFLFALFFSLLAIYKIHDSTV